MGIQIADVEVEASIPRERKKADRPTAMGIQVDTRMTLTRKAAIRREDRERNRAFGASHPGLVGLLRDAGVKTYQPRRERPRIIARAVRAVRRVVATARTDTADAADAADADPYPLPPAALPALAGGAA